MDTKILVLAALIGLIAAFAHAGQTLSQRDRSAKNDRPVLPI
jgi:hypothetical protein